MTETVKHTSGPWAVENPMGADIGLSIVQAGLKSYEWTFIAMVQKSEPEDSEEVGRVIGYKEQMANARLIAAAPELLEALSAFVRLQDEKIKTPKMVWPTWETPLLIEARAAIAKAEGRA